MPDEVVDRFCLLGPPSAQLERLAELRALGVDQFAIYAMHDAREATIEAYGTVGDPGAALMPWLGRSPFATARADPAPTPPADPAVAAARGCREERAAGS